MGRGLRGRLEGQLGLEGSRSRRFRRRESHLGEADMGGDRRRRRGRLGRFGMLRG